MRKSARLGLVAVAAFATLPFASAASAAYAPTLTIFRNLNAATGDVTTDVTFAQTQADDPTARVTIYAPTGFSATLNQAVGTQIGSLDGQVFAAEITSVVPVQGSIVVADKTSAPLMAAATQCTGKAAHNAIWILNVSAAGNTLQIPAYVDVLSGLPFASGSIVFCLSHPSQVVFKIRLLNATLHIKNVFAPPAAPGSYRWTAVASPWEVATPMVNPEGTVELQSLDRTPVTASFAAKRVTKTRKVKRKNGYDIFYSYSVKLSGQVRRAGQGAADGTVDIYSGKKKIATVTTDSSGSFSATIKLAKTSTFTGVASRGSTSLVGASCEPRLPFPGTSTLISCGTITEGGFTATTVTVTVKKPKLTVKHVKNHR